MAKINKENKKVSFQVICRNKDERKSIRKLINEIKFKSEFKLSTSDVIINSLMKEQVSK